MIIIIIPYAVPFSIFSSSNGHRLWCLISTSELLLGICSIRYMVVLVTQGRNAHLRKLIPGISKSHEFDTAKTKSGRHSRSSKSNNHSSISCSNTDLLPLRRSSILSNYQLWYLQDESTANQIY